MFAERQGFEPRVPHGTAVFKTAALNHSAISPYAFALSYLDTQKDVFLVKRCKGNIFTIILPNFFSFFFHFF